MIDELVEQGFRFLSNFPRPSLYEDYPCEVRVMVDLGRVYSDVRLVDVAFDKGGRLLPGFFAAYVKD